MTIMPREWDNVAVKTDSYEWHGSGCYGGGGNSETTVMVVRKSGNVLPSAGILSLFCGGSK